MPGDPLEKQGFDDRVVRLRKLCCPRRRQLSQMEGRYGLLGASARVSVELLSGVLMGAFLGYGVDSFICDLSVGPVVWLCLVSFPWCGFSYGGGCFVHK